MLLTIGRQEDESADELWPLGENGSERQSTSISNLRAFTCAPTPPPLPRSSSANRSLASGLGPLSGSHLSSGSHQLCGSQLSLEFNAWYNSLGIHQVPSQLPTRRLSVHDWLKSQPLRILQLDTADREVLKIAGKCFFFFFFKS